MPRASQDRITAVRLEIAAAASKLQGRRTAQLVGRIRKKAVGPLVDLLQYGIKLASTSSCKVPNSSVSQVSDVKAKFRCPAGG
jgi:hypothetical protein